MKVILAIFAFAYFSIQLNASEIFIRVSANQPLVASIGTMTQFNNSNTFRFFDLPAGTHSINFYVQANNGFFSTSSITIGANQQIVAEVNMNGNTTIVQTTTVQYSNWYTEIPQNGGSTWNNSGQNNQNNSGNQVNSLGFIAFLKIIADESFDSKKLERCNSYLVYANLSAQEIAQLSKEFDFDSNRVEFLKNAFPKCYDKQNYFLVEPTLSFQSNVQEIRKLYK